MFIDSKRLKLARVERGLSQAKLAEETGINTYRISMFETGKGSPSERTMEKLTSVLGVSFEYLTGAAEQTKGMPESNQSADWGVISENLNLAKKFKMTEADKRLINDVIRLLIMKYETANLVARSV